jgi:cell wall-associated NlpC family hydrolase
MASPVTVSQGEVKTPAGDAPVIPLLLIGLGGYLMWFGVKYWRGSGPAVWPSYPIKSVLQGRGLPAPEPAPPVSATLAAYESAVAQNIPAAGTPGGPPGGSIGGSSVATDALRYAGHCYVFGGAARKGSGCWDCSSFVNWVVGHDLRLAIPGVPAGGYDGSSHGPVVAQWLTTSLCKSVTKYQPGDLVIWGPNAHMGIVTSPGQMISALNPALGTRITPIAAAHTGLPVFRRLVAAQSTGGGGGGGNVGGSPQNMARLLLARFGWGSGEMAPLISLWNRESGWNPRARNPSSGALGIAQALGHGGSGTGGTLGNEYGAQYGLSAAQARQANSGSALQQIRWGLGYIKARYGSPAAAWAHEQSHNWY